MLLACFILPASAQNSWGIVGGGLFSKSLSRDARFSLGGYAGGMYDVHVKNSWYVQPQLLFTYEEFISKTRLGTMLCLAGINPLITPMATECILVWAGAYDGKELKKTKYFDPTYAKKDRSFDETVKLIGETIQDSVDYHQIADVEVGSFLSGGVDSSYIASTVKPMKTYSVGFEVGGFDETTFSKDLCDILHMSNDKE
ncbi:protein containing Asparagine synthase domain protein, partial [human gut metagenome]